MQAVKEMRIDLRAQRPQRGPRGQNLPCRPRRCASSKPRKPPARLTASASKSKSRCQQRFWVRDVAPLRRPPARDQRSNQRTSNRKSPTTHRRANAVPRPNSPVPARARPRDVPGRKTRTSTRRQWQAGPKAPTTSGPLDREDRARQHPTAAIAEEHRKRARRDRADTC